MEIRSNLISIPGIHSFKVSKVPQSVVVTDLSKIFRSDKPDRNTREEKFIVANNGISLSINRGEIFGLLGPNGAGKTTLINQILGLSLPTTGSIMVETIDVVRNPAGVKAISSYLPQRGIAFDAVEVFTALVFAGQLKGMSRRNAQAQAKELIEDLDLTDVAHRYIRALSGGMRRVVGLAIGLMGYPKLLVLDEPTNELDPVRRKQVWEIIKKINKQRETTCILVTHNVLEAESVLDRTAIISEGKVIAVGTPGELKQQISNKARIDLAFKSNFASTKAEKLHLLLKTLFENAQLSFSVKIVPQSDDLLRWALYLPFENSNQVLELLVKELGLPYIDDFKLSLTSLEDVYLNLIKL
ncbi:MAG TPA: ABC transporter ATP-binding protein [Chloroflexia bacterium]|nr:ABC transporter ATP-binding protein [Chloroflexia bacterium]